ncbi:YkgJ family cysteine cluster protein [Fusibacter paucivorans]|uniref:YkgJ family cysteine cluster protein n=1 Tax=Fusibacter paucivorans TaxID=76009 RepID=A0ABS5PQT8_9FIRM|nr:YkgJ family cysteine cluster protein [Fusibacter paucivorans]MBS7527519.1 YkgJ family cysteine cluster protein [Fusibacter paucivorans]
MKTIKSLTEISDGKLYDYTDVVKADTGGCLECHACCVDVGDLVSLTPYDTYEMMRATQQSFAALTSDHIAIHRIGKLNLPYLKMHDGNAACSFLNMEGRCSIHNYRPNICRLFPLGRVYDEDDFKYILQQNACVKSKLEKVKIKKWIGIDSYPENKAFLLEWHRLLGAIAFRMKFIREADAVRIFNDDFINGFYSIQLPLQQMSDVEAHRAFYKQFYETLPTIKNRLGIL